MPGPRYTSYPTADRFVEAFGADEYVLALQQRRLGSAAKAVPLSLYVHIPFCESLCYYCACNKIITRHPERADVYLRYLSREIDLHMAHCALGHAVSQLHIGGGSPTFLGDEALQELMNMLRRSFTLVPGGEYSIEVDPRTVDAGRLARLAELGFNRLSFGVQDFDPAVQKAVHRVQPAEQVFALVQEARRIGFESINVDLIYGLPRQTPESFDRTLAQVCELRPDRIALYAYAHLPERFKAAAPHRVGRAADGVGQGVDAVALAQRLPGCRLRVRGDGPFRAPRGRAGRGQAAGAAAPQLPGATARSPTATSSPWASRPSAAWAPPTARTPRRSTSITT